jgi:hypothetical protein
VLVGSVLAAPLVPRGALTLVFLMLQGSPLSPHAFTIGSGSNAPRSTAAESWPIQFWMAVA